TFGWICKAMIPTGLPHAGEPGLDATAINMLKDAAADPPSGGSGAGNLTDYCKQSIGNEPKIHYSQARPMTHLGVPPAQGFTCDCSGHSTSAYYWAGWIDPNKRGFDGYGYTGTLCQHPKVSGPYQVGDLGFYSTSYSWSNTTHVVTCYVGGDSGTSLWCSHGQESGPTSVRLHYRSDYLGVCRPPK